MTKGKSNKLQIAVIIILVLGIFAGVYLTQKIQILMSRASDGLTLTDFLESFGTSEDEENYNYDLDINQDGKINVIDILFARSQEEEEEDDEETTDEEPTPTPFEEQYFTATDQPDPTNAPSEAEE